MPENDVKRSSLPVLIPQGAHARSAPIKLSKPVYVLGSKDRCRIHLVSSTVSSTHALLVQTRHLTYIRDLCSRSHIYVNGKQVTEAVLADGDLIAIGKFTFKYQGPKKEHSGEAPAGPVALEVTGAEFPIPFETRAMVIGRRATCDIPLIEEAVSTAHAVIFSWEGKRFARDLWSRTGTFVNGKPIHEQELNAGDVIRCGDTEIKYSPSLEDAAFAVIEGASDSIIAQAPRAQEVATDVAARPLPSPQPAMEVILPPVTPPKQEELLPLEALDQGLMVETGPHDTAHVPLAVESPKEPVQTTEAPQDLEVAPLGLSLEPVSSEIDSDLPRRGWRSAIQEEQEATPEALAGATEVPQPLGPAVSDIRARADAPDAQLENLNALDVPEEEPAGPEVIAPTEPTLESALDLPVSEEQANAIEPPPAVDMTDTMLGRSIEEFEGPGLGPIVESSRGSETEPAPQTLTVTSDASSELPPIEPTQTELSVPSEAIEPAATVDASALRQDEIPASIVTPDQVVPTEEPEPIDPIAPAALADPTPTIEEIAADSTIAPDTTPDLSENVPVEPAEQIADSSEPPADEGMSLSGLDALASASTADAEVEVEPEPPLLAELPQAIEPPVVELAPQISATVETALPPGDFGALPPESITSILAAKASIEDARPAVAVEEPPNLLDDAEEAPAPLSPDDTAMMVLATEQSNATDIAPAPADDQPLILEPLPIPQNPPTISADTFAGDATIDSSAAVEPEAVSAPILEEDPAADAANQAPPADAGVELPLDAETTGAEQAGTQLVSHPSHAEQSALGALDAEPMPILDDAVFDEPLTDQTSAGDLLAETGTSAPNETQVGIDHAAVSGEPAQSNPPTEVVAPTFEQTLDLSRLSCIEEHASPLNDAPLDESAAMDLLDNDHSTEAETQSVAPQLDLSHLNAQVAPVQDSAPAEEPLISTAAQPVDDVPAGGADDPVDFSFLNNAAVPLDENTAVDLLVQEEPAAETISVPPPQPGGAVFDASVLEPQPEVAPPPVSEEAPHIEAEISAAVAEAPPEAPDILPPVADDAILGEALITDDSQPLPPPPMPSPEVHIEPPPGIRPRTPRPRVIRNAFGQDPNAPKPGAVFIPPFADTIAAGGEAITMASLSAPPVRETDVFSDVPRAIPEPTDPLSQSTPDSGDIFAAELAKSIKSNSLTGLSGEAGEVFGAAPMTPSNRRGRSRTPGLPATGPRPAIAFADQEALAAANQRPRKLMRRVLVLMTIMLILIGGTWAGVYRFYPIKTTLQASLHFNGFDQHTRSENLVMQAKQVEQLQQEATRNVARHKLEELHPGMELGFIADPQEYATMDAAWPGEVSSGELQLRYNSTDPKNDKARLQAVAMALYEMNSLLVKNARTLKSQSDNLLKLKQTNESKLSQLAKQAEDEKALYDLKPSQADLDNLADAQKDLDAARTDAEQKLRQAQAELEQLKTKQAAALPADADPTAGDTELAKMTKDAADLNARLAAARKGRADLAAQARATLDAAYDEFKKQADTAQSAAKSNPELASYINAAQNLQAAIREITDQYIEHQQQDYTSLNQLKNNFVSKMTERNATMLANDPKLKEMAEQKEIKTRKYNEAINSGLDKEAAELAIDLKSLDTMMKAQRDLVSADPVYNDFLASLQQMIDQKQKSINDQTAKTDQKLAQLRQQFNKSAVGMEKLPAEQKELASAMRDRLAAIDAARKQYAEASDAAAADADTNIKRISDDLTALQTNIEARKQQLASVNSPDKLAAAQDKLKAQLLAKSQAVRQFTQALADAQAAYDANHAKLLSARTAFDQAEMANARLQKVNLQIEQIRATREQNDRELAQKSEDAKRAIEPVEPQADDVKELSNPVDNRFAIAGFSSLGIFVAFAVAIMFTLLSAARASQYTYSTAFEPLETPAPSKIDEETEAIVA